jgi:hypothetical protein
MISPLERIESEACFELHLLKAPLKCVEPPRKPSRRPVGDHRKRASEPGHTKRRTLDNRQSSRSNLHAFPAYSQRLDKIL